MTIAHPDYISMYLWQRAILGGMCAQASHVLTASLQYTNEASNGIVLDIAADALLSHALNLACCITHFIATNLMAVLHIASHTVALGVL